MNNCCKRNCCCNCIPIPGPQGPAGNSATSAIGTTTTGNPGTNASVTNSGTNSNAVLNFVIPKGEPATINYGCFISRISATYTSQNSTIALHNTLNYNGITINSNGIISIPKNGRYLINYGITSSTSGNIIGIYINGNNNSITNLTTNNTTTSSTIILNLNNNDLLSLRVINATNSTPLILPDNTINAYITIISLD